jgi:hypothetical protein
MKRNKIAIGLLALAPLSACSTEVGDASEDVSTAAEAVTYKMAWSGNLDFKNDGSAVVSSGPGRLELFTLDGGKVFLRGYSHAGGWRNKVDLGKPNGKTGTSLAAVKNGTGHRIDLFAVGDNKIWHRFKNGAGDSDWSAWFQILNHPTVHSTGGIAVTSWGPGRLDLFWLTNVGGPRDIGHAWAINDQWAGTEVGNASSAPYLRPLEVASDGLTAVSWGPNRIDLFFPTGLLHVGHHWYDNGWNANTREVFNAWGVDAPAGPLWPGQVVVASKGVNQLEVFVRAVRSDDVVDIYRASFNGAWPLVPHIQNTVGFEVVEHHQSEAPPSLDAALRWSNGARLDLFGENGDRLWQAFK